MTFRSPIAGLSLLAALLFVAPSPARGDGLRIQWEKNLLTISEDELPGREMRVQYSRPTAGRFPPTAIGGHPRSARHSIGAVTERVGRSRICEGGAHSIRTREPCPG
jgi:hypothetical protein